MLCEKQRLKMALPVIGFTVAFWPLVMWYFRRLTDGGDEPLGFVVLLITACLIWRNKSTLAGRPLVATYMLVIYAITLFTLPQLPPMLYCILALFILAFYYGWHQRPGWLALLTLSLPVVASMQFYLGYPMRVASAEITRLLLNPWVDGLIREGTNLSAFGKVVGVDPPCSGIRMLWTGLVMGNFIAAMTRMTWTRTILFNAFTLLLIVLGNSIRSTLLYAPESGMIEIPDGLHELIGILCYLAIAVTLIKFGTGDWGNLKSWQKKNTQTRIII